MKGLRYKITISRDPLGVHEVMQEEIEEVFVPDLKLFINKEEVFIGDPERRVPPETEEVSVDASGCAALQSVLIALDQLKDRVRKDLFD